MISRLPSIRSKLESRLKPLLEKVEANVGIPLLDVVGTLQRKSCKLVGPKQIFLPQSGVFMKYHERRPITMKDTAFDSYKTQKRPIQTRYPPPTLLLFPGVGSPAAEYCSLLRGMNIEPHVRVLIPDYIGLGEELKSPQDILESTAEFLDLVLRDGSRCNALGTSLGGGLLYFLRARRPGLIQKTVLVAPTIPSVLATPFCDGRGNRQHNPMVELGCRDNTARTELFRNYLWTDPRKRQGTKDSLPITALSSVLENMYQTTLRGVFRETSPGHDGLNSESGIATPTHEMTAANDDDDDDKIFAVTTDLDRDCDRLLVWPEEDQISDLERGRLFFGPSVDAGTTRIETIPACGHLFDTDLKPIYERIAPSVEAFLLEFSDDPSNTSAGTMELGTFSSSAQRLSH